MGTVYGCDFRVLEGEEGQRREGGRAFRRSSGPHAAPVGTDHRPGNPGAGLHGPSLYTAKKAEEHTKEEGPRIKRRCDPTMPVESKRPRHNEYLEWDGLIHWAVSQAQGRAERSS